MRKENPETEYQPVPEKTQRGPDRDPGTPEKAMAGSSTRSNTGSDYQIPREKIDPAGLKKLEILNVRSRIRTESESNRGYQAVAEKIIHVSEKHLFDQQRDKMALRKRFATLFSVLLIVEYLFLVLFILLDGFQNIPVEIPDTILQLFTTSVFLQTLSAMGVMIAFAFFSKEETRIVGLLNQTIQNYQKFQLDDPQEKGGQQPGMERRIRDEDRMI